ncbi:MAG: trigger factor [Rhodobacteraceae bacterium]|nr:trigger factor [Paracoccaceae bacterium]
MSRPGSLCAFEGAWIFEREITDRRGASSGRVEGRAVYIATPDGLAYEETGQMRLGQGAPMTATRRYLWKEGRAGRIAVFFEDGRAFHDFELGAAAHGVHFCDPDTYKVAYDFENWPNWRVAWRVAGPAKDYKMVTLYRPAQ